MLVEIHIHPHHQYINIIMQKINNIVVKNAYAVKQYALIQQPNGKQELYMQDRSFIIDRYLDISSKSLLLGIFDGHGSAVVSSYLKRHFPDLIKDIYKKYKHQMKQGMFKFIKINNKIKQSISKASDCGSTATLGLLVTENFKPILYLAYVGDSSAYIFQNFRSYKLTAQHRCTNKFEAARVIQQGGKIVNNRLGGVLLITRAFGDFNIAEGLSAIPDVLKIEISPASKYLVIASDGLWDFIDLKLVVKILNEFTEVDDITYQLIKTAQQNGSKDNITVIVLKF